MSTPRPDGRILAFLVAAALAVGLYAFVSATATVIWPFVLGMVAAYLVRPALAPFEARGIRRDRVAQALALVGIGLLAAAWGALKPWALRALAAEQLLWPSRLQTLRGLPDLVRKEAITRFPVGGERIAEAVTEIQAHVVASFPAPETALLDLVQSLLLFVVIPFVGFFALVDGPRGIRAAVAACPPRHVEKALSLLWQIDGVLGAYLRGLLTQAVIVSGLTWVGLSVIGLRDAAAIGIVVGFSNMIPYLGPIAGTVLALAAAFLQFGTPDAMISVLVFFAALQFVDNWVLQPFIMGRAVELHPVVVAFSLLAGGQVFGFWGLLFAVPVVSVLRESVAVLFAWYAVERGAQPSEGSRHALEVPYL